ncbi:FAD/NADP-binding domain-containing protein [Gigaspora margarita]|uniref:FAD/NADP-binding domain-containing protein n=1 Tax=Gigaspora margarita TaxID=4874 RepID=A0A8H4AEC8_GIGMA|nr:FAD/NADP-binding domain-containing protein [Gigaspora margarita]
MSAKPNIVIVGGGYGGIAAATKLELALHKTHQIILIERKTHFYHAIGGLRTVVEDGFEHKVIIPYDNLFKNGGKVVHATVTTIHKNEVIVDTETEWGTHIPFEYLIIATGSNQSNPAKMTADNKEEGIAEIIAQREAVKNANKILIIGGGPVGIELAGEIASVYQDKEVTLIHSEDHLLTDKFPKKMTDRLAKQLREFNVKLIFGEKVIFPSSGIGDGLSPLTLETDKGTQIYSDVQFVAFGAKPNTEVIKTLDQSLIEQYTTLVKVMPTLQLEHDEYAHIFALGDITNIKETKLAYRANLHADVITKNIIALINNKKLAEYKPGPEVMIVPVGKAKGAGLLPIGNMVIGSFMTKSLKGKTLMVDKTWKSLNATLTA